MITMESNFRLPHYNIVKKTGKFNRRPHGGAALFVHESVPSHNEIALRTDLQAVAYFYTAESQYAHFVVHARAILTKNY